MIEQQANREDQEAGAGGQPPASADAATGSDTGSHTGSDTGSDTGPSTGSHTGPDTGSHTGPDTEITTESIIEAILFATDSPVTPTRIAQIVGAGGVAEVKRHIAALNARYEQAGASFRIEEIAKGFQMLTLPEYNVWLRKLLKVRGETRLSQAALETLAVVAYKQPVMRVEIEEIRGVAAGDMLQRLREINLVKIVGRAEEIGRPLLYGTTRKFLQVFGLASLDELPRIEALTPPDQQVRQPSTPDAPPADGAHHEPGQVVPGEVSAPADAGHDLDARTP